MRLLLNEARFRVGLFAETLNGALPNGRATAPGRR